MTFAPVRAARVAAVLTLACAVPAVASAARVPIAGGTSSSSYPSEGGVSYGPEKAFDGRVGTAWAEGDKGSGLNAWIELDLGGDHTVRELWVWGGMWYSSEFWGRANRPKELEVKYSDDSTETFELDDEMVVQKLRLAKPKSTSSVRLRIKGIHSGTTWLDTAISEVQVFDTTPGRRAKTRAVSASSTLAADNDGNYEPSNVTDGLDDTMWCEGSGDGDGVGEHLLFTFGGPQNISELNVINGIGGDIKIYMKGNRAVTATLEFSDGSTHAIKMPQFFKVKPVSFPAKSTSTVKLTFDTVKKGTEYNDLCISEAYFQ